MSAGAAPARVVIAAPGDPLARTGGYIYNRRLAEALAARGWQVDGCRLADDFPHPAPASLRDAAARFAALADGTCVLVDSLALGAMPDVVAREASRLRLAGLVHLPLSAHPGLDAARRASIVQAETRAMAAMRRVVVTGAAAGQWLAPLQVPSARVAVVEPGTDPAPLARGSRDGAVHLACVATLAAGKGHDVLLRALATIPARTWRLTCAGSRTRDPRTADAVRALAVQLGVDGRVAFAGDLEAEALAAVYHGADLFVLASERETYGMAVAEALARGLPVVATATGAAPALVGREAGTVVPPGDVLALSRALATLIGDAGARARCAAGARRVRRRLPTWDDAAAAMARVLDRMEHDDVR